MFRTPDSKRTVELQGVNPKEKNNTGNDTNVFAFATIGDTNNVLPRTPERLVIPFNIPESPNLDTFVAGASQQVEFSPAFSKNLTSYRENMCKRSSQYQISKNAKVKVQVDGFSTDEDDDQ